MYKGTTPVRKMYGGTSLAFNNGIENGGGGEPAPTPDPYQSQYLTFEALESGAFSFSGVSSASANTLQYSVDSGTTWTTIGTNTNTPTVQSGNKIMWKGSGLTVDNGIATFMSSGNFNVEGNVMSLINGDGFATATTISKRWQFRSLFRNCTKLISAENMVLPATTLATECYQGMFYGCTGLTTTPELPATTLAERCYNGMFEGCTSLTTAPELPATTLKIQCYSSMFAGCTSLTTAPELPATTLMRSCCFQMFRGCTSLTTAPELPVTTLYDSCYSGMFSNCTNLNSVTCLATDISAAYCTMDWLSGVAANGTFTKAAGAVWPSGESGIPNGWTVVEV